MYFGFKYQLVQLFCNTNLRKKVDEIFVYFYGCQYKAQIMYQGQPLALLHCTVITVTYYYWSSTYVPTYYLCINFGMGVFIYCYYYLSRKSTIHATISLNHSLSHLSIWKMFSLPPLKKISPHMLLQIFDQIFVNGI